MEETFSGKKIVITGASGFIGSHLTRTLVSQGAQVTALLDTYTKTDRIQDIEHALTIEKCSAWDHTTLTKLLQKIKPEIIFHLRSEINPNSTHDTHDSFYQTNVTDTITLAQSALQAQIPLIKFIHAGTIAEYGATPAPFREDKQAQPISEYGKTKLKATEALHALYVSDALPVTILRFSVVYGPQQHVHSYLIPNVIQHCLQKKNFHFNNTGKQTRDPLYVSDAVDALLYATQSEHATGEIINVSLGEEYQVQDIARMINECMGNNITISTEQAGETRQGENEHYWQDISKAQTVLNWKPKITLKEGLLLTIQWYTNHL